jgi:hypothetical protein
MEQQDRGVPTIFVLLLMQFFVGLLLFIALLHGQRDLIVLSLLVLGLVFGAKLWTRISLSGIKSHSTVTKRKVFPGEKLALGIKKVVKYPLDCRRQSKKEVRDMTTQENLIKRKQSLLELAEYLQNISQACKINGVSRQHFYDIKKTYEE